MSNADYNQARGILAQAGSDSARKSHPKHGGSSPPDSHGQELLREARDEFRAADAGQPNLHAGMTQAHYDAVHRAADVMGLTQW